MDTPGYTKSASLSLGHSAGSSYPLCKMFYCGRMQPDVQESSKQLQSQFVRQHLWTFLLDNWITRPFQCIPTLKTSTNVVMAGPWLLWFRCKDHLRGQHPRRPAEAHGVERQGISRWSRQGVSDGSLIVYIVILDFIFFWVI